MNILIAPDKFKGSLTALEVCNAVEAGAINILPTSKITKLPLADGGEGSLEAIEKTIQFKRISIEVKDPLFRKIKTYYGLLNDIAYIEMAMASGLQLLSEEEQNPILTSSFGTGEIIFDAIKKGAKKIFLFVGGSATNDAGIGIASALGYLFIDKQKQVLKPVGGNLIKITEIDSSNANSFKDIEVVVLTDVNNTLFGKDGAANVYAKQKGANKKEIAQLDKGLKNISEVIKSTFGKDVSNIPGSGAAGGVGAGSLVFCIAKIESGIETILDLLKIDKFIQQSDLIITGEGLLDKQTLEGKVVKGVVDRCKVVNKPRGIVCGDLNLNETELKELNATTIKSIKTKEITNEDAMQNAYSLLVKCTEELMREF
ncbi:MAG: glycerate kinase [Ignavibacteriae bacterium]|nr:glycerate kinase [Ignavibacteriota bacterium]